MSASGRVALALFRSGALKLGEFKLKSGVVSPYYIDLTRLLSSPEDFRCIVDAAAEEIRKVMTSTRVDKLASNENPLGPSPRAVNAMRKFLNRVNLYPDGSGFYLKRVLARKLSPYDKFQTRP